MNKNKQRILFTAFMLNIMPHVYSSHVNNNQQERDQVLFELRKTNQELQSANDRSEEGRLEIGHLCREKAKLEQELARLHVIIQSERRGFITHVHVEQALNPYSTNAQTQQVTQPLLARQNRYNNSQRHEEEQ